MLNMMKTYMDFYLAPHVKDEKGQGMVEYGLIVGLISIVVIIALTAMGTNLNLIFEAIKTKLTTATPSP